MLCSDLDCSRNVDILTVEEAIAVERSVLAQSKDAAQRRIGPRCEPTPLASLLLPRGHLSLLFGETAAKVLP
jgi:hypothetical protein